MTPIIDYYNGIIEQLQSKIYDMFCMKIKIGVEIEFYVISNPKTQKKHRNVVPTTTTMTQVDSTNYPLP